MLERLRLGASGVSWEAFWEPRGALTQLFEELLKTRHNARFLKRFFEVLRVTKSMKISLEGKLGPILRLSWLVGG